MSNELDYKYIVQKHFDAVFPFNQQVLDFFQLISAMNVNLGGEKGNRDSYDSLFARMNLQHGISLGSELLLILENLEKIDEARRYIVEVLSDYFSSKGKYKLNFFEKINKGIQAYNRSISEIEKTKMYSAFYSAMGLIFDDKYKNWERIPSRSSLYTSTKLTAIASEQCSELIYQIETIYGRPDDFRGYPCIFTTLIEIEPKKISEFISSEHQALVEAVRAVTDYDFEIDEVLKEKHLSNLGYPLTVFCQKEDADSIALEINSWCVDSEFSYRIAELTVHDILSSVTSYYKEQPRTDFSDVFKKVEWQQKRNLKPKK